MAGVKRLETLSPAQMAHLPEIRDKWIMAGLCTAPANRSKAEEGIHLAYQAAGMKPPRKIVWTGSPLSSALTRAISMGISIKNKARANDSVRTSVMVSVSTSVGASVWASVGDSVWDSVMASVMASVRASVRASVCDSVWDSVMASVMASVRASVWDSVMDSVGASVWAFVRDSVWASVEDSVGDSVGDSVRASVRDSVWDSVYGQHDADWLGFFDTFASFGVKPQTEKLRGLWLIALSAGWFLPHKNICWIAERPDLLRLESVPGGREFQNRLHCDDGPAMRFPDGWEIYALHGVRMSREQHALNNPSQIMKEENAGIRAALIRRIGIERMLSHLPHKNLSTVGDYSLLSIKLSDQIKDARYLKMKNPSVPGVWHLEGVHPTCADIEEAINWRATGHKSRPWNPEVLT